MTRACWARRVLKIWLLAPALAPSLGSNATGSISCTTLALARHWRHRSSAIRRPLDSRSATSAWSRRETIRSDSSPVLWRSNLANSLSMSASPHSKPNERTTLRNSTLSTDPLPSASQSLKRSTRCAAERSNASMSANAMYSCASMVPPPSLSIASKRSFSACSVCTPTSRSRIILENSRKSNSPLPPESSSNSMAAWRIVISNDFLASVRMALAIWGSACSSALCLAPISLQAHDATQIERSSDRAHVRSDELLLCKVSLEGNTKLF